MPPCMNDVHAEALSFNSILLHALLAAFSLPSGEPTKLFACRISFPLIPVDGTFLAVRFHELRDITKAYQ